MSLVASSFYKLYEFLLFFISLLPKPHNLGNPSDVLIASSWLVIVVVTCVHILYIIYQFWTTNKDVVDYFMYKRAIDINDIPAGSYRYLITVYTNSWRLGAGTDAKVYIQMHGVLGQNTICYYLHNPYLPHRKLFRWADVSWFSLNTSIPMGEISSLTVSHDNTGEYTPWHLSKIIVRDLQMKKSWRFFANCWLTEDGKYPQAKTTLILKPVDPDYVEPFLERVFEWAYRIFFERPLNSWQHLNYITPLSRSRRLTIAYVYVLLLMLLNIAYFENSDSSDKNLLILIFNGVLFRWSVTFFVLTVLNIIYSMNLFTTRKPRKTQYYIRIIFAVFVHFTCIAMTILIVIYSTNFKHDSSSWRWFLQFMFGVAQSELIYAFPVAFTKGVFFTLFSKDPFEEETAKIQLTRRISKANTFSHNKDLLYLRRAKTFF